MKAILTGDISNSEHYKVLEWMPILKDYFPKFGETPEVWEIYRGDEFQLKLEVEDAMAAAIALKARIKSVKGLDVRIGIGLGEETFVGSSVSESNGTAYQYSGRVFEKLKDQKVNLAIASADEKSDATMNLILKLALDFMDDWSPVSAEIVAISLENPNMQQQEIAEMLGIKQSAVSQRQKRARLDLVWQVLDFYKKNHQ